MDGERKIYLTSPENRSDEKLTSCCKEVKLMFKMNFLLGVVFAVFSLLITFHYWTETNSVKRQLETINDHFVLCNLTQDRGLQSALIDSNKNLSNGNVPVYDLTTLQKELFVVQFNGGQSEVNLGTQTLMGPWIRDEEVSSKNSAEKFELTGNSVTIKEGGLYFIYAQVIYLTQSPNCYYIWARQTGKDPRLLSTCATGDDSSNRPLSKSQMSCSLQTVARLYKGDTVNIAQRELNRTVWLRPGFSYFGFLQYNLTL